MAIAIERAGAHAEAVVKDGRRVGTFRKENLNGQLLWAIDVRGRKRRYAATRGAAIDALDAQA